MAAWQAAIKIYVVEVFRHFVHYSVVTNAREYRRVAHNELKKTMAHRKQVRLQLSVNSHQDEVQREPEEPISLCSGCQME